MLTCREVTQLVSESMDSKLPRRKMIALRFHFMMCVSCSRYLRQTRLIRELIRHYLSQEESTTDIRYQLSSKGRQKMKQAIQDAKSKE